MSKQTLQVCLLQMHVEAGDPDANYERVGLMLEEAVTGAIKPDIVMLPEMWNTGYALDRIGQLADKRGERTLAMLSEWCGRHGVNAVAGSVAVLRDGDVRNTAYVLDRSGGLVTDYSKIHLFRLMQEEKHLTAGERPGQVVIEGAQAGLMICYDIRFPELCRTLALGGAKVLFVPAQWPNPRLHHWRTLLTARAIENQMYVVACNRVGESEGASFFGHSMVIDPWGEIVAEGDDSEQLLRAEINLGLVDEVRARIPVFEDRRPSLYNV